MAYIQDRYWVMRDGQRVRTAYTGKMRYRARWREYANAQQKSKTFERKVDAEDFLNELSVSLRAGAYIDPAAGRITFRKWWNDWHGSRSDLEASTTDRNDVYWRLHIEPALGDLPLTSIDRAKLRAWVGDLVRSGMAPRSVRKCAHLVRQALEVAVEDRLIASNPASRMRGLPKVVTDEARFCTAEEVARLVEAFPEHYRPLIATAAWSGLRLGELTGLRRRSLDLMRRRIEVVDTIAEVRGQMIEKAYGKSAAARRSVPLPRHVVEALVEHTAGMAPGDLVFTVPGGGPIRRSNFHAKVWQPAVIAAGLGERVLAPKPGEPKRTEWNGLRPHDLRHTAVSFWISSGADMAQLKKWAGHESVATLIDLYGHLMPDREGAVIDALDALAAGVAGSGEGVVVELARPG